MGLYFEDFETAEAATTASREVTDADIMAFAHLTGDFVRLHTDEEYAKTTRFGRRIAHGALVFSISIGLGTELHLFDDTIIAFAGVERLRFVAPVFPGDRIHAVKRVAERKALAPAMGTVVFETRVLNQRDELVLAYHDKILLQRRPATPPETPPQS